MERAYATNKYLESYFTAHYNDVNFVDRYGYSGNIAVREPELFNTEEKNTKEKEWYLMAPMQVDRLYHSNVILLPDGRVMAVGSNPHRTVDELRIELHREINLLDTFHAYT